MRNVEEDESAHVADASRLPLHLLRFIRRLGWHGIADII